MGKPRPGIRCAIVKLERVDSKTTVRVDSSASRGFAREETAGARLLFPAHEPIVMGDRIDIAGFSIKVDSVMPRFNLTGELDHNQVDGSIWANG